MQTQCQWCAYSLAGLPPRGRCPECARLYDATWVYESEPMRERVGGWLRGLARFAPTPRTISIVVLVLTLTGVVAGLAWYGYRELVRQDRFGVIF